MQAKDTADSAVDSTIGARVRARRRELGLSQSELAHKLGVSFQQVQKYESGANRISASTLMAAARALETSPSRLLEDEPPPSEQEAELLNALTRPDAMDMLQAFNAIADPRTRSALLALVREIATHP